MNAQKNADIKACEEINPVTFNLYLKVCHAFIKMRALPNIIVYAFYIIQLDNRKNTILWSRLKKL